VIPSDVDLYGVPPLVGKLGKAECEHTAAFIVFALQQRGDTFSPIRPREVGEVLRDLGDGKIENPTLDPALLTNPFIVLDVDALIDAGFARFSDSGLGRASPIELTKECLIRLPLKKESESKVST